MNGEIKSSKDPNFLNAKQCKKRKKNPLISHKDSKGRPVGKGGEARRKKIMDYVDSNS